MSALGRKTTAEKAAAEEKKETVADKKKTAADVKAEEFAEKATAEQTDGTSAENSAEVQPKAESYAAESSAEAQPKTENSVAAQAAAEKSLAESSAAEKSAEENSHSSFGTAANLQQELKNQLACGDRQRRIAAALLDKAEKGDLSAWKLVAELVGGIQNEDTDRVIRVQISGFEE